MLGRVLRSSDAGGTEAKSSEGSARRPVLLLLTVGMTAVTAATVCTPR